MIPFHVQYQIGTGRFVRHSAELTPDGRLRFTIETSTGGAFELAYEASFDLADVAHATGIPL